MTTAAKPRVQSRNAKRSAVFTVFCSAKSESLAALFLGGVCRDFEFERRFHFGVELYIAVSHLPVIAGRLRFTELLLERVGRVRGNPKLNFAQLGFQLRVLRNELKLGRTSPGDAFGALFSDYVTSL